MNSQNDQPAHIRNAKFLRLDETIDYGLWPRDPSRYSPSNKFRERIRQLQGGITGDDISDIIRYGHMHPAARGCIAFSMVIRGVAIYIVAGSDLKGDRELLARPSTDRYPDLDIDDFNYTLVTLWPYVINREEAWRMNWPTGVLDLIEELAEEQSL